MWGSAHSVPARLHCSPLSSLLFLLLPLPLPLPAVQVKTAKNHTPGFVVHPVCMLPSATVGQLYDLRERRGFTSVCVTGAGPLFVGCLGSL